MLASLLDTPRKRVIAVVAVIALAAGVTVAIAALAGDDDEAAPTTTTTSTTTTSTTTSTAEPAAVAPLTGLPDPGTGHTARPALVVKLDNVEPKARPQAGINQADVVYEERVEGSVTRLLAVFHSTDAAPVGPVRSARSSDIAIFTPLNRPFFAWSGANATFAGLIRAAAAVDVGYDAQSGHYYRERGRPAPSNLMIRSTVDLMALPAEGSAPPPPLFHYRAEGEEVPHLEPVTAVRIVYGTSAGSAPVEYRWNGEGWARTQAGTPHVDADGVQVAPANVIIQFTPYHGSGVADQFGNDIPEAALVGEGDAWILTAGGLVPARWSKPSLEAVTTYTDADGNPVKLRPGRTWVALPPPGGATKL
ncbi:MAG TPA: DUF3048 domain-containing protein [Acidimicrobiales bacterium]|nr:DUF3048 domain-containing protein [Acidimicrobiales bacterium]